MLYLMLYFSKVASWGELLQQANIIEICHIQIKAAAGFDSYSESQMENRCDARPWTDKERLVS